MNPTLLKDLHHTRGLLVQIANFGADFLERIKEHPPYVGTPDKLAYHHLPASADGAKFAVQAFLDKYQPYIPASGSGRFLGYVVGGATPASVVGDWLTSVFDGLDACEIAETIEKDAVSMLQSMLKISLVYKGCFVTGATVSNFVGLASARQWVGLQGEFDFAKRGLHKTSEIKILCGTPHSSIYKAAAMCGLGRDNVIRVGTHADCESIDIAALEGQLQQHENCIVVENAGTVTSASFDDFKATAVLKARYNFWLHVDASFGAFANCVTEYQHLLEGWQCADSITVDAHKWLNVPYDAAVFWTKYPNIQRQVFQNGNSPYSISDAEDLANLTPENSRRMRAIGIWLTLVAYGEEGYRNIVKNNIQVSKYLAELIKESTAFELLSPHKLNIVCFTLKPYAENKVRSFLKALNDSGKVFMTSTIFQGKVVIRAAFCNWRTEMDDIDIIFNEMKRILNEETMNTAMES